MDKRQHNDRAQKYQHLFCEIPFGDLYDNKELCSLNTNQGLYFNDIHAEELSVLKEKLHSEMWRLAREQLTDLQFTIMKLKSENWSQTEIAVKLGCNQSSIAKALIGNLDYKKKKDGKPRRYGGCTKKLRKAYKKDPVIQEIIEQIHFLEAE